MGDLETQARSAQQAFEQRASARNLARCGDSVASLVVTAKEAHTVSPTVVNAGIGDGIADVPALDLTVE